MRTRGVCLLLILVTSSALCGCRENSPVVAPETRINLVTVEVQSPANPKSGQQRLLCGPKGELYLSWIEKHDSDHRFMFSKWSDRGWTKPRLIAKGSNWFVNWADVPAMAKATDGTLAAHWLERMGRGTYAYGIRYALSRDDGATWTTPQWIHADQTPTEHGFATIVAAENGGFVGLWLDGNALEKHEEMELHTVRIDSEGNRSNEHVVDSRVCECCATAAVSLPDGEFMLAYRNRSLDDIRDIYRSKFSNGTWQVPQSVHDDGWKTPG